jgi:hypothetical protein
VPIIISLSSPSAEERIKERRFSSTEWVILEQFRILRLDNR